MEIALLALIAFLAVSAIGMPIGPASIVIGMGYLLLTGQDVGIAGEKILNGLSTKFLLLAVPLFIFTANVMDAGTISRRLLEFCQLLVGRFRGGLAQVNIVASVIFSGMSGSAIADAAGIGRVIIGMMVQNNRYSPGFAAALTAASATIGPIIPPSIPMILYALVADTSILYLFLGGVIPGLMMAFSLMVIVAIIARRRNFPTEKAITLQEMPGTMGRAFLPLMTPVILVGGIYAGVTTPTESSALAALYALILAIVVYRALNVKQLYHLFRDTAKTTSVVGIIVGGALLLNYIVANQGVPFALADLLSSLDMSPLVFLITVTIAFLVLGAFLETPVLLLVLVPMLIPTVNALGIDRVHFGVVIVVNIMIGLITPPMGVMLFVINGLTGIPLGAIIRELWPFFIALTIALFVMVVFPETVLWLPRHFGYRG